ncbi:MAG: hypothetical protein EOO73_17610 [Myxococcales bacterium]|nr:MAG: hypothetical protein EOO73_17610 [Myxococcales bacterium]
MMGAWGTASAQTAPPAPIAPPTAGASGSVAQPPPTAPPVAASECFPHCRTSYTCYQAQCISLCNPPCAEGQSCTSVGECVPAAAAPPIVSSPPPPPPPVAPLPASPALPRAAVPAWSSEPSALRDAGTFVLVGHLGVELFGAGHREDELCDTGDCQSASSVEFSDKSPVVLGVDGLFHATRGLRLGLGYWLVPYSAMGAEPNRGTTFHIGSEHALNAIIEGLAPLRPNLALALRVHAGPRLLITGGDLAQSLDSFLSACSRMPVDHCEADKGPFFGGQAGTAVGLLFGSRVRARLDLAVERYFVQAGERRLSDGPLTFSSTVTNFGTRFWALAGIEL